MTVTPPGYYAEGVDFNNLKIAKKEKLDDFATIN
jgi:hypothetical protein